MENPKLNKVGMPNFMPSVLLFIAGNGHTHVLYFLIWPEHCEDYV